MGQAPASVRSVLARSSFLLHHQPPTSKLSSSTLVFLLFASKAHSGCVLTGTAAQLVQPSGVCVSSPDRRASLSWERLHLSGRPKIEPMYAYETRAMYKMQSVVQEQPAHVSTLAEEIISCGCTAHLSRLPLAACSTSSSFTATSDSSDEVSSAPSRRRLNSRLKAFAATFLFGLRASFVRTFEHLAGQIEAAAPGALDVIFFICPLYAILCTPGAVFFLALAAGITKR